MGNEVTKVGADGGAVVKSAKKDIKSMLMSPETAWGKELCKVLPDASQVGRFMACALGQLADPKVGRKLAACTPTSFYNCIMKSARCGIVPDGANAYLIPYGQECTLQFSYRGLCDFAIREGVAKKFTSDIVRRNDIFKWSNGELVEHTINDWDEESRGEIVGVWVRATLPNGDHQDMRLSKSDIEKIRSKSQNPNGVWKEWYEEMAKKACIKRLFKTMRNTPQLAQIVATDNENFDLDKKPNGAKRTAENKLDFGDDEETPVGDTIEAEAEVAEK